MDIVYDYTPDTLEEYLEIQARLIKRSILLDPYFLRMLFAVYSLLKGERLLLVFRPTKRGFEVEYLHRDV